MPSRSQVVSSIKNIKTLGYKSLLEVQKLGFMSSQLVSDKFLVRLCLYWISGTPMHSFIPALHYHSNDHPSSHHCIRNDDPLN